MTKSTYLFFALSALLLTIVACGPSLFKGTAVHAVIDEEEITLESSRGIDVDDTALDPYGRVELDVENLSLGWPSTDVGTYEGSSHVRFEYEIEHNFERVTYRTRYCDFPVALVEVTRHDYGLISGSFAGEVCQFEYGIIGGVPRSLIIGGNFSATIDDSFF